MMRFASEQRLYMEKSNLLPVEVVYATAQIQVLIALNVRAGSSLETAIQRSGILARFPEIDLMRMKIGVFSAKRNLNDEVMPGDRIEIYRELQRDPKQRRRLIAAQHQRPERRIR